MYFIFFTLYFTLPLYGVKYLSVLLLGLKKDFFSSFAFFALFAFFAVFLCLVQFPGSDYSSLYRKEKTCICKA